MTLRWDYDRYGNRTAQTVLAGTGVPSNVVTINPATNRITDPGYGYDLNGNMTQDGLNTLTYDGENRLVSSTGTTYSYDGNSLRVKKVLGGTTTVYVFSGTKVIAEYVNGALSKEYVYSGGQLIATHEGATLKYHQSDHLSVRVSTDTNGAVIGQQGHFPFGESWYASSSTTKWQFTTYERDTESGNDYAIFRSYVNRLGRFSSPDPIAGSIADPQSLNHYAYVRNDPVNLVDPGGLEPLRFERVPSDGIWNSLSLLGIPVVTGYSYIPVYGSVGRDPVYVGEFIVGIPTYSYGLDLFSLFRDLSSDLSGGPGGEQGSKPQPPKQPCSPPGILPRGAGIVLGGSAANGAGPLQGGVATGSVGGGLFFDPKTGASVGGFATGGATAYASSAITRGHPFDVGAPRQNGKPATLGAVVGGGAGAFLTNAGSVSQLNDNFNLFSVDAGAAFKISVQIAYARGIWYVSATIGPGSGFAASTLTTNTVSAGTGCK